MKRTNEGILCLFLAGMSMTLAAQESKRVLTRGVSVTADISKYESHSYQLPMEKDQFALVDVMQKGVDLVVTTHSPDGKVL